MSEEDESDQQELGRRVKESWEMCSADPQQPCLALLRAGCTPPTPSPRQPGYSMVWLRRLAVWGWASQRKTTFLLCRVCVWFDSKASNMQVKIRHNYKTLAFI